MYDDDFLGRLRAGLAAVLPRWGFAGNARLGLLAVSENATFLAEDPAGGGRRAVFRVYRPAYHALDEILSELAWIEALLAEAALDTPRPVPTLDGAPLSAFPDGNALRHVAAFEVMDGAEPPVDGALPGWFGRLGALSARLHAQARAWARPAGFRRKTWDFGTTIGATPHWGDWRAGLGLDADGRAVIARAAALIEARLGAYGKGERFGLVHADLRLANLLVHGGRLGVIDFDDCGMSWFGYDFAASVSFIEHEPVVPALMAAWVAGYRTVAPFSPADEAMLPVFVMLRRILLTAWIASHRETPTATALGPAYGQGTAALASAFLRTHG